MRIILSLLLILSLSYNASAQDKPAYQLFDIKGKKSSYKKMIRACQDADVVFFGELHNNAIAHWLQYEIVKDLGKERELILGAEMFEADNQQQLTDYVKGRIDAKALDSTARLWNNYSTDYAPLVNYAKENNLDFIATNIPRRYANLVYRGGFEALDTLSEQEKGWIAPMPFYYDPELPSYKNMLTMMGEHSSPTMPMAQASKDVTMAYFIAQNHTTGKLFIHFNGSYHSDDHEGIVWYLLRSNPDLKIVTITTKEQENITQVEEENSEKADFIIVVDKDVTHTY